MPNSLDNELSVLDVVAQNPTIPVDNTSAMATIAEKLPTDLSTVDEFHVAISECFHKTSKADQISKEALRISKRGLTSAQEAADLNEIAPGLLNPTNPIGLYTESPSPANVEDTVTSLENTATTLLDQTKKRTKDLLLTLGELLKKQAALASTQIDEDQNLLTVELTRFIETHGDLSYGLIDNISGNEYLNDGFDSDVGIWLSEIGKAERAKNPVIDYLCSIETILGGTMTPAFKQISTAATEIQVNSSFYELSVLAKGTIVEFPVNENSPWREQKKISLGDFISAAGRHKNQQYFRALVGAMLGIVDALHFMYAQLDLDPSEAEIDPVSITSLAYEASAIARVLQTRLEQAHLFVQATAELYRLLCGVSPKQVEPAEVSIERFVKNFRPRKFAMSIVGAD